MLDRVSAANGLVGAVVIGITAFIALRRLRIAGLINRRNRFTTWRWGKVLALMSLIGMALKLMMPV